MIDIRQKAYLDEINESVRLSIKVGFVIDGYLTEVVLWVIVYFWSYSVAKKTTKSSSVLNNRYTGIMSLKIPVQTKKALSLKW